MTTAIITHPDCLKHEMGPHHPECPARLQAVYDAFEASGLMPQLRQIEAPLTTRAQLAAAHAADYVDAIFDAAPKHGYAPLDPDTSMNPYSLIAARRAEERSAATVADRELMNSAMER